MTSAILSAVHDEPQATEDEQEQGLERLEQEEEMRGPGDADTELPAKPERPTEDDR